MTTRSHNKDFALIRINSVIIGTRFRKELGDIVSLAKDISETGLLQPIVINQNNELIRGLRRIEAFKALGKSEIPAYIVNLDDIIKGEISENTQRKDFSLGGNNSDQKSSRARNKERIREENVIR